MRFSVFEFGQICQDGGTIVSNSLEAVRTAFGTQDRMITIPVWGLLIQCQGHNILFDLGCMDDAMGENGWREEKKRRIHYTPKDGGSIEECLDRVGLTVNDIDIVIASHLHMDHYGGIEKFSHCDVYVPKEEWVEAMIQVFSCADENTHGSYYLRSMSVRAKKYHLIGINEDFELFPGLQIITLPGHAVNLLGVLLTTDSGKKYLFPSDAIATPSNYGPPVELPGKCKDPELYEASIEKVRKIVQETQAEICYSHYYPYFETLQKAPHFYE